MACRSCGRARRAIQQVAAKRMSGPEIVARWKNSRGQPIGKIPRALKNNGGNQNA